MSDPASAEIFDEDADEQQCDRLLDKHCAMLMEHFESVRIFVTRKHPSQDDVWQARTRSAGNWYANKAVVDDWVVAVNARTARDATSGE